MEMTTWKMLINICYVSSVSISPNIVLISIWNVCPSLIQHNKDHNKIHQNYIFLKKVSKCLHT